MNIILTHGYFLEEDAREQEIMKPYPPLGLLYVSAYLEQHGFDNEVFDTTFSSFAQLADYLRQRRPRVLGIYTNLMTRRNVLRLLQFVRREPTLQHTRLILGGPEVRHHREAFLQHGADLLVLGEGEETMLDLARHFDGMEPSNLTQIPGIAYRDAAGNPVTNPERPLLPDLDALPLPNRCKIDLTQYFSAWRRRHGYSAVSINTMRGCPYGCKWCSRAVYGQSYRRRSPVKVIEEIDRLRDRYHFDRIWFVDDVFTINHRWLREFAGLAARRPIPYEAITRADRMNEEVVALLRDSGCFRIWIGAESGSQAVLDAMNRMVNIEKVAEMIALTRQYGIEAGTFIMLGYPGETERDIEATLRYLRQAGPDHFTITTAYPIKGTPLYEEVASRFLDPPEWSVSSDRDIDFQRTYPRRYYDHAVNWIQREMAARKSQQAGDWPTALRTKLAALRSRTGMWWSRQGAARTKPHRL